MKKKGKTEANSRFKRVRATYSSTANTFNIAQASGTLNAKEGDSFTRDDFIRASRLVSASGQPD